MNVLLLSMPDSFEHMPPVAIRMPNGALTSLAGNVDPHHRVAVADLILVHRQVRETVTRLVRELDPEVVGLSIMTFQRRTAGRIIDLVRASAAGSEDRGRRVRSQPCARSLREHGRRLSGAQRGGSYVPRTVARDRAGLRLREDRRTFLPKRRELGAQSCAGRRTGWKTAKSACRSAMRAC